METRTEFAGVYPGTVLIEAVTECRARCPGCPKTEGLIRRGRLAWKRMQLLLKDIKESPCKPESVVFGGYGEPLLWGRLCDAASALRDLKIPTVSVVTGGVGMTVDNCFALLNSGVNDFEFTIDAATQGAYSQARRGWLCLARRGLERLLAVNSDRATISVSMTDHWPESSEADKFVEQYRGAVGITKIVVRRRSDLSVCGCPMPNGPCNELWQRITLSVDGRYRMCCRDSTGKTKLGWGPPSKIWNCPRYKRHRKAQLARAVRRIPCGKCEIWKGSERG